MDERSGIESDDVAARAAWARYRRNGLEPIDLPSGLEVSLSPGEVLLAVNLDVGLLRADDGPSRSSGPGLLGTLFVTTDRLVHLGVASWSVRLEEIEDAALGEDRILLVLRRGSAVVLVTDRPRLVRARISIARAAAAGKPAGHVSRATIVFRA